ncbi:MAG: TonB-dependent receptor [Gammaproteobacteria bacterium]|nr:TonB-dependent receptor [Gammaproteobacteria bacterium]
MQTTISTYRAAGGSLFALALLVSTAHAQVLEEVVVTAQKREQSLQDVGISVTAFTGDQLHALGLTSTDEISQQTPGLLFTAAGGTQSIGLPAIRGVGQNDFGPHQEVPNAVYVDEGYLSFNGAILQQMFDLERVEVLRGPQGTLFGRNATGGLMHFISRKPTEKPEAYADLTLAEYEQVKFEGAVSGPLSERLRGRLAVGTNYHGAFIDNRIGPDTGDTESYSGRGQLQFQATDRLDVLLSFFGGTHSDDHVGPYQHRAAILDRDGLGINLPANVDFYGTCPGCDAFGYRDGDGDPHAQDLGTNGFLERDTWGVTGNVKWDFDRFVLTSISHYVDFQFDYLEDNDVSPTPFAEFLFGQDASEFTQELRVNGETERSRWVAGFYYLNIDSDNYEGFHLPLPITGVLLDTVWNLETESWAVFGQFEYDFAPKWTFIGGLRWTEDSKEMDLLNTLDIAGLGIIPIPYNKATVGGLAEQSNGDYSFKTELDFRPTEDWLLYFGVTRGNKGGSFSAPLDMTVTPFGAVPYHPETLTSYEGGFKATLWDGRARLNASAFYYDYKDYQAFRLENATQIVFNADAELYGLDIELYAQPAEGWDLVLGASWLDATVFDVTLPSGRVTDRAPPQAPSLSINGLARREWPFWQGHLAVQGDFNYVGDYQASVLNSPATEIPQYVIGNARLSYRSGDERWEAAVFVKNIADAGIRSYAFDLAASGFPYNQLVYLPPRWVGGQVVYHWE